MSADGEPGGVIMIPLEAALQACRDARAHAEKHYGIAEGVGADMAMRRISALAKHPTSPEDRSMTDTTQPPAETLAEAREIAALFYDKRDPLDASYRDIAHNIRRGRYDTQEAVELVRFTMAYLAALTRRADGDAVPEYAPDDISHLEGLASYLDGYARDKGRAGLPASKSLFEEIAKRLREYDAMRTPKPPAGGDALVGQDRVNVDQLCERVFRAGHSEGWTGNQLRRDAQMTDADKGWSLYVSNGALAKSVEYASTSAALALPAPVVEGDVVAACGRIQKWMDDEHRMLAPGEAGAGLSYDDVTTVLRAALSEGRSHG